MPETVVIATDLSPGSEPALVRGRAHAEAIGAPWVVVHVVHDVSRHSPLLRFSSMNNDVALVANLTKKAAELVSEQVGRVLSAPADSDQVRIEVGDAADEVVRVAEDMHARIVVVGAKVREGTEVLIGKVAERVVRYAHASVLVARPGHSTGKALVATDFTESSQPAVRFAGTLTKNLNVDVTLLHVMQIPKASPFTPVFSALGSPWVPPSKEAITELEELGTQMLSNQAKELGFKHIEQVEGTPAEVITERAEALDVEMIVVGSHSRTGLRRFVLGSTAEAIVRLSNRSVLVVRA